MVGAVIPWNAPLLLFAQKVAPALAAGCTIVLKPSEYATFAVLRLAALIEEAGAAARRAQRDHRARRAVRRGPDQPPDAWTSCRSPAAGRWAGRIMTAAAAGCKRVSLELGGKSPAVVFADAAAWRAPPR